MLLEIFYDSTAKETGSPQHYMPKWKTLFQLQKGGYKKNISKPLITLTKPLAKKVPSKNSSSDPNL